MDDDWDLHAVVRGCAATARADGNDSFPSFLPGHLNGVQNSSDFTELEEKKSSFQGLQQICKHSSIDTPPPFAVTAAVSVPMVPMQTTAVNTQPTTRSRRSPVMKMVREMTQEELSSDSWAWRKYGQKPIKGSPYPRNYYRCSTSKVCGARKQVERSPNDPGLFMVSYTGDHTHPRPAYRSFLSGSTRNKVAATQSAAAAATKIKSNNGIINLSPPASGLSFSPSTPLLEGEAAGQNDDVEVSEEEEEVLAQ